MVDTTILLGLAFMLWFPFAPFGIFIFALLEENSGKDT